jgi:GT2 family glycosyltransferase
VIAVVVVTFSAPSDLLDRCLAAITSSAGVDRVIVVDNGGRAAPTVAGVEVVRVANRGYGAAANAGFDVARTGGAGLIALLNDDVIVRPGWIAPLVAEFDAAGTAPVGAVQPMLLFADGDPEHDRVNSLGVRLRHDGSGVDVGLGDPPPDVPFAADIALFTGGAVMFDTRFLDATGGFDERYFLYYEDVDLGLRGAERGWRYRIATASVVEHVGGATTGGDPRRTRYLQERNRLWTAFRFGCRSTVAGALWLSIRRLRHAPVGVHARALLAGVAGAPSRLVERARARSAGHGR